MPQPPSYNSQEEYNEQSVCEFMFDSALAVNRQAHEEYLILESADDGPLQERLDKWLAAMRAEYDRDAGNWRRELERRKTVPLQQLKIASEEERSKLVKEAEEQLAIVDPESPIDGVPCRSRLKLTLEDVKGGAEGIRDAFMHEVWAKKN